MPQHSNFDLRTHPNHTRQSDVGDLAAVLESYVSDHTLVLSLCCPVFPTTRTRMVTQSALVGSASSHFSTSSCSLEWHVPNSGGETPAASLAILVTCAVSQHVEACYQNWGGPEVLGQGCSFSQPKPLDGLYHIHVSPRHSSLLFYGVLPKWPSSFAG